MDLIESFIGEEQRELNTPMRLCIGEFKSIMEGTDKNFVKKVREQDRGPLTLKAEDDERNFPPLSPYVSPFQRSNLIRKFPPQNVLKETQEKVETPKAPSKKMLEESLDEEKTALARETANVE